MANSEDGKHRSGEVRAQVQLVAQEDSSEKHAIEARVQHRKLALGRPGVERIRPAGAPYQQQVTHLKDGKHHELKKRRHRKRVEDVLYNNTCMAAAQNLDRWQSELPTSMCQQACVLQAIRRNERLMYS